MDAAAMARAAPREPRRLTALAALLALAPGAAGQPYGDPACWGGGVTPEMCCDPRMGPQGNPQCWDGPYTYQRCCVPPKAEPVRHSVPAPMDCAESDVVYRHAGQHAIFVDLSLYGHKGCYMNDCKRTDKFDALDWRLCARVCAQIKVTETEGTGEEAVTKTIECTHWSFGPQGDGKGGPETTKCFFRSSDAGREAAVGWLSGARDCTPGRLPLAFTGLAIAESRAVKECDDPEKCPDKLRAAVTWRFAHSFLLKVAGNGVDEGTMQTIRHIAEDNDNLIDRITGTYRPSDADFPRVVYNNRLIFNNLREWLDQHPKMEIGEHDASLPNPLRFGTLCGKVSCWEL